MTTPAQPIRILRERIITRTPRLGEETRTVAISWQIPPNPPQVLFAAEDDIPDLNFRRENPDAKVVPEDVRKAGITVRRDLIMRARERRQRDRITTI